VAERLSGVLETLDRFLSSESRFKVANTNMFASKWIEERYGPLASDDEGRFRPGGPMLYTGYARDPGARVEVHNSGKGAKYTRSRLPVSLVYVEQCESLSAALKRERQLKPWSRAKKEALVAGDLNALKRA
jgi:putative endonuclease